MPVTNLSPTIKLIFKGLFLSFIKDKETLAQIGSVLGSPCHRPRLSILKNGAILPLPPELELEDQRFLKQDVILSVKNTSQSKISVFRKPGFNRSADAGDGNDFQWQLNLETEILLGEAFSLRKDQIGPIFQTNSGVFFTSQKTPGQLKIKRKGSANFELIGRAAQIVAANVKLDQLHSAATLSCGGVKLLTVDACDVVKGNLYEIVFDCECDRNGPPDPANLDIDLVFNAVKPQSGDQPVFEGEPPATGAADPQVFCTGGGVGVPLRP